MTVIRPHDAVGAGSAAADRARTRPATAAPSRAGGTTVPGLGGSRPTRLLLHAVVALPLALMAAGGWLTWRDAWRDAESDVTRTAEAGAEYARRLLDGHRMAAERVNDLLRGLSDDEIRAREATLHETLRAMLAEAPELRAAYVGDRQGRLLLGANVYPVPRDVDFSDREWYPALSAPGAAPVFVSRVYFPRVRRNAGALFVLARRRTGSGNGLPPEAFDGLITISFTPQVVGNGLRRLLVGEQTDTLALVRADGQVLARTTGLDAPVPRLPADGAFARAVAAGAERALFSGPSPMDGAVRIAAMRRVEGYPLYAIALRPRATVTARWSEAVAAQLAFGLPAALALAGLALLVRRGQRDLAAANAGLERHVAERTAALAQSEARYRDERDRANAYFETAGTMLLVLGPDMRVRRINRAGARILGVPAESIIGRDWIANFVPERLRDRAAGMFRAYAEGRATMPWHSEAPVLRADGTEALVAWRTSALRDPAGRFAGMVSSAEEVTERRRAEAALRESEERLRLAQEAGDVGAWEWDIASGALHWSASCHRLHGTDPAAPVDYATWRRGIHPDDRPAVDAALERALDGKDEWEVEFRFARVSDGAERWIVGRGEVVREDGTNRPLRMLGVALDVTARREAEAAALAGEERLRLALAAAEMGVWEFDLVRGVGLRAGPLAERLPVMPGAGFPFEEWLAPMHPDDRARVEAAFRDAIEGRTAQFAAEFRVRRPDDGAWLWIASQGAVVRRDPTTGAPSAIAGVARDITDRKAAEERQALLTRELDHRAKNALAVVQAALRLTPRDDPDAYATAVEGRVAALARAHTLLAAGRWEGAAMRALLEAELAPFLATTTPARDGAEATPRVALSGPALTLAPSAAQALSMTLHELATNATKYGALSAPGGRVRVCWRPDRKAGILLLRWIEDGGPALAGPPPRRGFGSRVIDATVRDQLGGAVRRTWESTGVTCRIEIPLDRVLAGEGQPGAGGRA